MANKFNQALTCCCIFATAVMTIVSPDVFAGRWEYGLSPGVIWPGDKWDTLEEQDPGSYRRLLERTACKDKFIPFATQMASEPDGLKTDGLVVVKDGIILYEYYDAEHNPDKPHYLWSASKSVTATIFGAALERGVALADGSPLSLKTPLHKIFSSALRKASEGQVNEPNYLRIRLVHLLQMATSFEWDESYESAVEESSVLRMLYLDGRANMPLYALTRPMLPNRPGTRWIYSGGNSNIIMAVLREISGESYGTLPWDLLFTPLGMTFDPETKAGVTFERDGKGNFVGSSYLHMSPRDMARVGYLYLRDGFWNGKRLLPEGWVEAARRFNSAQANTSLGPDYVAYINREGIFSERSFWLNIEVPGLKVQFPNAPRDMYFAAGHYGQLLIVLPSENMVIARTGHDAEYWSKIDAFVSQAMVCFS